MWKKITMAAAVATVAACAGVDEPTNSGGGGKKDDMTSSSNMEYEFSGAIALFGGQEGTISGSFGLEDGEGETRRFGSAAIRLELSAGEWGEAYELRASVAKAEGFAELGVDEYFYLELPVDIGEAASETGLSSYAGQRAYLHLDPFCKVGELACDLGSYSGFYRQPALGTAASPDPQIYAIGPFALAPVGERP